MRSPRKESPTLRLAHRLALRPKEAAEALGIGERTLREILPELPHLRVGGLVLIPVKGLEQWLEQAAATEAQRGDAVAEAVIAEIRRGGK